MLGALSSVEHVVLEPESFGIPVARKRRYSICRLRGQLMTLRYVCKCLFCFIFSCDSRQYCTNILKLQHMLHGGNCCFPYHVPHWGCIRQFRKSVLLFLRHSKGSVCRLKISSSSPMRSFWLHWPNSALPKLEDWRNSRRWHLLPRCMTSPKILSIASALAATLCLLWLRHVVQFGFQALLAASVPWLVYPRICFQRKFNINIQNTKVLS